jgi:hypothetical protein
VAQLPVPGKVLQLAHFCAVINAKHPLLIQLCGIDKPIGISTYELIRALPKELRSALPTVEEIEAELTEVVRQRPGRESKERKQ